MDPAVVSIIVPCWREDAVPTELADQWLKPIGAVREILVAVGGRGGTVDRPAPRPLVLRRGPLFQRPGRGNQMNEAARLATGDLLLFHHADTELTDAHLESLRAAMADPALGGGAFRRRFDERHPRLRWLEPWEALRCRRFGPLFGDQSIFVRRTVFEAMGGFAEIPLMEDVEFLLPVAAAAPGGGPAPGDPFVREETSPAGQLAHHGRQRADAAPVRAGGLAAPVARLVLPAENRDQGLRKALPFSLLLLL